MKMRIYSPFVVLGLGLSIGACGLLDVENPNNLVQSDVENIAAANAAVNGAQATVIRAWSRMIGSYSTTSDEFTWIGSRDAWLTLNQGNLTDPANEFVDQNFPYVGEARWMTDEAVRLLEGHFADAPSADLQTDLGRAYLYAGMAYTMIGEMFDDFALSDRREAAPPIGEANMNSLLTTAIGYYTSAITNADAVGDAATSMAALAMRMRAQHSLAVWGLLNPAGSVPANPLVDDAGANADASALIAAADPDWRYDHTFIAGQLTSDFGGWVNSRQEMQVGESYATTVAGDLTAIEAFILEDPVDTGAVDPRFLFFMGRFLDAPEGFAATTNTGPLAIVSVRMAHLILAEAALAGNAGFDFNTSINAVRALDGMTPFAGQIADQDMLVHERRVNLFLHGQRLHDHYRFGIPSNNWLPGSDAVNNTGQLFPITRTEILSNPNIS
ncbi:MAG: RagB/SusD family nutrient uptake outer membrane protein [Longimicrobiales bacterium]